MPLTATTPGRAGLHRGRATAAPETAAGRPSDSRRGAPRRTPVPNAAPRAHRTRAASTRAAGAGGSETASARPHEPRRIGAVHRVARQPQSAGHTALCGRAGELGLAVEGRRYHEAPI